MNARVWFCRWTALTLVLLACPQLLRAEGDADALYNKAIAAQTGKGAALDLAGGKELLLKAAEAGSGLAMSRLGDMYRLPDGGVALNMAEARRWYDKAAAASEPYGLLWSANLGDGTLTPEVKAERYAKAKEIALSLALKNSRAVFVVGTCYVVGQGVQQDVETGIGALQQAAGDGEVNAMRSIASSYSHGDGLPQDPKKAFEWYTKAAESGFSINLMDLGICYQAGRGVAKDDETALKYFLQGVDRGSPRCMVIAGQMIALGSGAKADDARAAGFYQKAADLGWPPAMYYLGVAYDEGKGIPQNHETAIAWMRKAAAAPIPDARKYLEDHGIPLTPP